MKSWIGKAIILLCVLTFVALGAVTWLSRGLAQPGPLEAEKAVVIPQGASAKSIAALLEREGVIADARLFEVVSRISGFAPTFKAGEYVFEAGISPRQAMRKLAFGKTASRSVTIPEGLTVRQALQVLEKAEGLTGEARPIPEEGRMFPDTYSFTHGATRGEMLKVMGDRMAKELQEAWDTRIQPLPLNSLEDLLILASIVQKEAANESEMPQIAGVFVNRLNKGMRLQSDPTVMYGADIADNNIRKKDLTEAHPFNTYVNVGLPPTPIANPGREALQAAARPAATNALFFMAMPDRKGHVFSVTYQDHQKAVKTYWDAYRKEHGK